MDLNTPENLDPKLKEAYERMMGQKPSTPVIQSREPVAQAAEIQDDTKPAEQTHNAYRNAIEEPVRATAEPSPAFEEVPQENHGLLFIIMGIGAIIFLIGYTFVWAKIFNLI